MLAIIDPWFLGGNQKMLKRKLGGFVGGQPPQNERDQDDQHGNNSPGGPPDQE
jgi:hypothetical protein